MSKDTDKEEVSSENAKSESSIKFFCKNCNILFEFEDETPLDDIKCPKCGTVEIFLEFEEDDGKIIL